MIDKSILPAHWEVKKLGEVCNKVEKVKRKEKKPEEELLYLDIGGIDNKSNRIVDYKEFTWETAPSRAQQIVYQGDTLFSTVRTYLKNIAFVDKEIYNGQIASSGFCVIRGRNYITDPKYLFYLSLSHDFLQPLNELQTGSSYPAVRDKDVFSQAIPLPPLSEQQEIVAKIEELFSELDKGKEQLETALKQLKVYRQAVLKWAFEGKFTNADVKDGELPEGWELLKLDNVSKSISDGDHQPPPKTKVGIPFITISNVDKISNCIDFSDTFFVSESYYQNLKEHRKPVVGDILYTVTGSFGIPVLIDYHKEFCFQRHIGLIRPLDSINRKYLYYLLQSQIVFNQATATATGTAQKTVSLKSLRNFIIPVPPLEVQDQIVQEVESRLSVCDKVEETITKGIQQAETLRQSILKKAFEGKLLSIEKSKIAIEQLQNQTSKVGQFQISFE